MWETDDTLRLTSLSPGAAAAIGRNPAELIGKQLTRLFRFRESGDGALPILTALAEHKAFDNQLAELRGGRRGRYRLSGVPLIDGMGRFAGFRGAAVAVRAQPEAAPANDPRLRRPNATLPPSASGSSRRCARRSSHIIDNAERLRAQPEGPLRRDYAGYAADIAAAGRHLLALVDDLVDLQAIERPDFRPETEAIDLADIARRAAGLLAVRAADGEVRIDAPGAGESLPATGDFTRALQILVNLIANAIRYTPEGGQVWIRTEREGDLACDHRRRSGQGHRRGRPGPDLREVRAGRPVRARRHRPRPLHRPPPGPRHGRRHLGRQRAGAGGAVHLHIASQERRLTGFGRFWTRADRPVNLHPETGESAMIEFSEDHFRDLCRSGRVSVEIATIEEKRKAAVKTFWLYLVGGVALSAAIGWSLVAANWPTAGFILGFAVLIIAVILAIHPLTKAGEALKHPVLEELAAKGGLTYLATGFDPPVYPDARKALFGNWLSGQTFTDLFHGTDAEGRRFALYEGNLTRKQGKNTVTIFSGQMYAFQRRAKGGGEIVIVPDRGLFNFFKPLSGMERVKFENDADFERRFEVYAYKPHEATGLLGPDIRRNLLALRQAGRVFAYIGPEDIFVAATGKNKFEAGSMFRSVSGEERVRAMFDDVCAGLAVLRRLRAALG